MSKIPRDRSLDGSFAMLSEGYNFVLNRCRRFNSDIFEIRLMFRKTICMMGEEAARIFYDNSKFKRKGAMPRRGIKTLLGQKGVQVLDGDAHKNRKAMFMSLMSPEQIDHLTSITAKEWHSYAKKWEKKRSIVLFDEVNEILCRAACRWTGVPLEEKETAKRTKELLSLIESPAAVGPRHWRGRIARGITNSWIEDVIDDIRKKKIDIPKTSPAYIIAFHRDVRGRLLKDRIAAVEVINLIRPIVAIGRFIIFSALALHEYPQLRNKIDNDDKYTEMFVQEVRRFYPFFPFVAAKVNKSFVWKGYRFPKGRRVILDLYGTDHDPRIWVSPDEFDPEHFRSWNGSAYNFIPQGGGDHYKDHRCAGEWITIEIMKLFVKLLTSAITYEVPKQNLKYSLSRIPSIPKSRFVMKNIKYVHKDIKQAEAVPAAV